MPTHTVSQRFTEALPLRLGNPTSDVTLMRTTAPLRGIPNGVEIWVTGDDIDSLVPGFLEYVGEGAEDQRDNPSRGTLDDPAAPKDQAKLAAQKAKQAAKRAPAAKKAPAKKAAAKKAAGRKAPAKRAAKAAKKGS